MYEEKADPLGCGSRRTVKLLENAVAVVERVLEQRIQNQVKVNEVHFGFMPEKEATGVVFVEMETWEGSHTVYV